MKRREPAFACAADGSYQPGMTLREYYAGQALIGMLSNQTCRSQHMQAGGRKPILGSMSKLAFSYADSMIKESER